VVVLHYRLIFINLLKQVSANRNFEIDGYQTIHLMPENYQSSFLAYFFVSLFNPGQFVPTENNWLNASNSILHRDLGLLIP
jgi:hypothetical protein